MNKIFLVLLSSIILFNIAATKQEKEYEYIPNQYFDLYAGVLKNEGGEIDKDLEIMACVLKNRLKAGWNYKYLVNKSQFSASYSKPSKEAVEIVKKVIQEKTDCLPVYFFYAIWYIDDYGNQNVEPILILQGHKYYAKEQYKELFS